VLVLVLVLVIVLVLLLLLIISIILPDHGRLLRESPQQAHQHADYMHQSFLSSLNLIRPRQFTNDQHVKAGRTFQS